MKVYANYVQSWFTYDSFFSSHLLPHSATPPSLAFFSTRLRSQWLNARPGDPVIAGCPAETYLGSRMRGGGLFERWPRGHRVKIPVMSRFPQFFGSVLVQIVSVFPEFYRCNIVASLWVVLMAFRGLNVQFKVDLYMVCHRSQLHCYSHVNAN